MSDIPQNSATPRRYRTYWQTFQRYTPYTFNADSWQRFLDNRTGILLRRIGSPPTEHQGHLVEHLVRTEWMALKIESEAETATTSKDRFARLRIAGDYRRQLLLLDRDLAKTVRYALKYAAAPSPPPHPLEYARRGDE